MAIGILKKTISECLENRSEPTSSQPIVKNSDNSEENVKAGENYEEEVERVSHLLGGKYKNYQKIAKNANTSNTGLKTEGNIINLKLIHHLSEMSGYN